VPSDENRAGVEAVAEELWTASKSDYLPLERRRLERALELVPLWKHLLGEASDRRVGDIRPAGNARPSGDVCGRAATTKKPDIGVSGRY